MYTGEKFGSILMSMIAIRLKYFQERVGSMCKFGYFKWKAQCIFTFFVAPLKINVSLCLKQTLFEIKTILRKF